MSLPNVIGGIENNDSIFLGRITNGGPSVLNFSTTIQGVKYYYWEDDINIAINNANFPFFTITKSDNGITLKDTINSGFLTFTSSYPYSINGQATKIGISSQFAPWGGSTVALSQVMYQLSVSGVPVEIKFNRQGGGVEGTIQGAMFLPASWFFCDSLGGSVSIKGKAWVLTNWFCFTNPSLSVCSSGTPPVYPSGFADLQECLAQVPYPYCFSDKTCGANNCKGPCPSGNIFDCELKDNNFICLGGDPAAPENAWWRSTWFIVLMVGVGLLAIGALILGIVLLTRKKKPEYEEDDVE